MLVIFQSGFRILDMSGSQNTQFCMRIPIFRSKTSICCVQKGKNKEKRNQKKILFTISLFLCCCFFFNRFMGLQNKTNENKNKTKSTVQLHPCLEGRMIESYKVFLSFFIFAWPMVYHTGPSLKIGPGMKQELGKSRLPLGLPIQEDDPQEEEVGPKKQIGISLAPRDLLLPTGL